MTSDVSKTKIGFVGIGNMGFPMAACLQRAGYDLTVSDASESRMDEFVTEVGGKKASELASLAAECDFVVTMLPNSSVVADVLFEGSDNLARGLKKGATLIEMSSGVPSKTLEIAKRLESLGVGIIDAPVSGGPTKSGSGTLTIMTGGEKEVVDRCMPILEVMGEKIFRTGALGSGQVLKCVNNLVSAGCFLISAEAVFIGQKFGLDPNFIVDVLNVSSGQNSSAQRKMKQYVLSHKYESGFSLDLMVKDLTIAMEVARDTKTNVPFASLCREIWAMTGAVLGSGKDHTAFAKVIESTSGLVPAVETAA
ncbi:NAD(P)-dependent oxidoreductase [Paraburkholderia caribensis]|uniref:NAD(P)-dependent oxidoreductase n=1 Tax=Paraburkholderia caribensis TaxID=75105 RepID=UPI001CB62888|nr:NAD(P)-dependent oxidoreductase [Paraburkholderia caribensis]CAG9269643.1 Hydroxyacid oxidoreductase [Paraburkholderia caribensis]